jgi:hypothetical protein
LIAWRYERSIEAMLMVSEVSPFQRLFALSENFQIKQEEAKDINKIFIRSVEFPSEAFVICPNRVSRFLHQVWGSVRKFFGWDKVCRYDQKANVQIIQTLFKASLKDLPNHPPEEIKQVINFALSCDGLLRTDEGKSIFANYVTGEEEKVSFETNKMTAIDVFYRCLQSLPKNANPEETLKRLCVLISALRPDPEKTTGAIDQLFANRIKTGEKPVAAWMQGVESLHAAGIMLPEGAQSCDAILSRPVEELTEPVLHSVFLEKLTSQQLQKAAALADAFYAAKITSLESILPAWEKIHSLGRVSLPQTSAAISEKLISSTKTSISDRYKIFLEVQDCISKEDQEKVVQAWMEQVDQTYPLEALITLLSEIGGSRCAFALRRDSLKPLVEAYGNRVREGFQRLSTKKEKDVAHGIALVFDYQERKIAEIAGFSPETIREDLIRLLMKASNIEISAMLKKLEMDLKISKKSYHSAQHSHHDLTAIKGYLLRVKQFPDAVRCLEKVDRLIIELDQFLEEKNPNVHVAKGEGI